MDTMMDRKRGSAIGTSIPGSERQWSARLLNLFGRSRNAIYALALFAGVAFALWRGQTLYAERRSLILDAQLSAANVARNAVDDANRALDIAELQAREVQIHIENAGGPQTFSTSALKDYLSMRASLTAIAETIVVADPNGKAIASSWGPLSAPVDIHDRGWFQALASGNDADQLGTAIIGRSSSKAVYTYSRRLTGPDGAFEGAINIAIPAHFIMPTAKRAPGAPIVQIWTSKGRFLFSNFMDFDAKGNPVPQVAPFSRLPKANSGFLTADDSDLIVAYQKGRSKRGLIATATLKRAEILHNWRAEAQTGFILFTIAVLVGGLLAKLAANLADNDRRARAALEESTHALSAAVTQRDLLLKEIHHRVKNNLQMTSSLMQIQAREFDNEHVRDAFKETQQRLYAIGMIHDVLYHDDSKRSIDMRGYFSRLSSEIARANDAANRGIRMQLDVDDVELMPEQATPLGLLTSEILINAYKHAFADGGLLVLGLHQHAEQVRLSISIGQDNKGTAEIIREGSLGARLVRTLSMQLRGQYGFRGEGGTVFSLTFRRLSEPVGDAAEA